MKLSETTKLKKIKQTNQTALAFCVIRYFESLIKEKPLLTHEWKSYFHGLEIFKVLNN